MQQSIYEKVLGEAFYKLHPMLQKRYQITECKPFVAYGTMSKMKGTPFFLYPLALIGTRFKLLFPEHGKNVPFSIKNTAYTDDHGIEKIHWERIFYFEKKQRYFNATMSIDSERMMIKDYLGEPSPLYSDLQLSVLHKGGLQIKSVRQRFCIGKIEIPLPKIFHGIATITENYNDQDQIFEIAVQVKNPLIGHIFSYEGVFTPSENT